MDSIWVTTPRGHPVELFHREGTTDLSTIGAIFRLWGSLDDEYGLGEMHPDTFLDIGGHIGTVTISVLLDNPEAKAVIVEPLPENWEIIEANLAHAGVNDRAVLIRGAIGPGKTQKVGYTLPRVENAGDIHRFVGGPVDDDYQGEAVISPTISLSMLTDMLGGQVDLMKIDCEGCEVTALKGHAVSRIDTIVGEWHGEDGLEAVFGLENTHVITTRPHERGGTGIFRAEHR